MAGGVLYGVGVGPGDPELLTLKAVRIIREADVIAVPDAGTGPGSAYAIAAPYLAGKELLLCATPMARDTEATRVAHEGSADAICAHLAAGRSVAYLCLGDVSVYSSYSYVADRVRARGYETCAIAGVTSFCAAAAALGASLCQGRERLVVVPADDAELDEMLAIPATKVLMKAGSHVASLKDALAQRGQLENATMVSRCGLPGEHVTDALAEADDDAPYLSLVIVREGASQVPSPDA